MEKVLIIKAGYSEILDREHNSRQVSLGDIIRTTPLLHLYKNDYVTWVTDEKAIPLLEGNQYIARLMGMDWINFEQLKEERFDSCINLEKIPGICVIGSKINAWKRYGFRTEIKEGCVTSEAYDRAFEVLAVGCNQKDKRENIKTFQELLFQMVGQQWKGEEYILGYKPTSSEQYDVALNTQVGFKWPTKAWPNAHWDKLEDLFVKDGLRVTRQDKQDQKILTNLNDYIDWLNSCRLIVTNDSLGMHLGIALKKKTLGLFGPTPHKEVYFYGRGKAITPEPLPTCLPCFENCCKRENNCMIDITPERVYDEAKNLL